MLHARLWVVLCLYIYSIFVLIYVLVSNYAFIHLFKKMKQVRLCIYCAHLLFDRSSLSAYFAVVFNVAYRPFNLAYKCEKARSTHESLSNNYSEITGFICLEY